MPGLELVPFPANPVGIASAFQINFQRIADALAQLGQVEQGTTDVTGQLIIDTGIGQVSNGYAVLNDAPTAAGCFIAVSASSSGAPFERREILIRVYKSDFTLSIVPVTVNWLAVGVA